MSSIRYITLFFVAANLIAMAHASPATTHAPDAAFAPVRGSAEFRAFDALFRALVECGRSQQH